MMKKTIYLFIALFFVSFATLQAQEETAPMSAPEPAAAPYGSATPAHMWELGVNVGHLFLAGDVDYAPGFGAGLHIRRALDYIFSLRGEFNYGVANGENDASRSIPVSEHSTTILRASIQGIITLNNMKWDKPIKRTNIYAFGGAGINNFKVNYTENDVADREYDGETNVHFDVGAGIGFRVNKKFNIGIEHRATMTFGNDADLIDAFDNVGYTRTSYRDVLNYTSLRLNFNLGNADEKAEPLYWINPLDAVLTDVSELKARPVFDLTDTDGDGVIDMMDQEPETEAGAAVDTRGVALDSDNDGVKDYMDKEPYSPPGFTVSKEGVAQMPGYTTKEEVTAMINGKMKEYELADKGGSLAGWFLPMIHFDLDSYSIRTSDYGHLAQVAQVLENNPKINLLVTGHTDKSAADKYNNVLSYNRAKSAIEFLINNHNVSSDRLILNYGGEEKNLVPSSGANFMNRRVEFRIAKSETNMGRPEGPNAGKGKFSGNRGAGY